MPENEKKELEDEINNINENITDKPAENNNLEIADASDNYDAISDVISDNNENNDSSVDEFAESDELFSDEEKLKAAEAEFTAEKQKSKKAVTIVFTSILLVIVAVGLGFGIFTITDIYSKSYILEFAGEKISTEEYKVFLAFTGGDKETAMETLNTYLIFNYAAKKFGITPDEEMESYITERVNEVKSQITDYGYPLPNVSDKRLFELFALEYTYQDIVNAVTGDMEFSQADFDDFMAESGELIRIYYSTVNVKFIITETEEKANEALSELRAGAEPDEVITEHSIAYADEIDLGPFNLSDLGLDSETTKLVAALDAGEFSDVIMLYEGTYVVFVMVEKEMLSDEENDEVGKSEYDALEQNEYMTLKIEEYKAAANIKVNEKTYSAVVYETTAEN